MNTIWVIVADAARARILASDARSAAFRNIEQLVHGESRLRDVDRNTDREGRSFDSRGPGRHAMESKREAGEQEAIRFAADIAQRISKGRRDGEFAALVLVAPPQFLGHLRQSLDAGSAQTVRAEINKEFSLLDDEEIRRRLQDHL